MKPAEQGALEALAFVLMVARMPTAAEFLAADSPMPAGTVPHVDEHLILEARRIRDRLPPAEGLDWTQAGLVAGSSEQ